MREGQQSGPRSGSHSLWLSRAALSFVALAAVMGWGASFVGLHAYGQGQMVGFSYWTAWLVPGTFDGAAFGATLITYRASIYGRSAMRGRMLMWSFTAISSWINWIHQISPEAQIVAAGLPIAAVAVFDVVLAEMRADFEERHGKRRLRLRPGLLLLRWIVDRTGTGSAFRRQVTDIPVSEIAGLATQTAEDQRASGQPESALAIEASQDEQDEQQVTVSNAAAQATASAANPRDDAANGQFASGRPSTTPYPIGQAPTGQPATAQPSAAQTGMAPPSTAPPSTAQTGMAQPSPQSAADRSSAAQATQSAGKPGTNGSAGAQPASTPDFAAHSPTARPTPVPENTRSESAEDPDDEDGRAEPTGSAAQAADAPTVMLPPVPASPLNELSDEDKRTFARRDYRLSLDTGTPLTGADLGRRYGYSERWGRRQIAAVRVEDREGSEYGSAENGSEDSEPSTGESSRHLVALRD